ncbi:MAG: bifunctional phosphopantothenoylcysteine decarboxylase/phosphopantothenate--cysteine ligase CoaBC [Saprospiraceae bacterium]|nr:bifunctional phosphopantothenoylcysteine decarboxylase/phosphopantothenate--cysteine ligase CoaBC [Saprospiraceae bacterium]
MTSQLTGKKILLCISGSIAAYKAVFLCRILIKSGCEVKVVMTPSATTFVTPLTLSTLSGNTVFTDISDETGWHNHVESGLWADAMIVAPATATTLAKMANGIADNMLTACYLSAKCPVFIAPAMDLDMWIHPSTVRNIESLRSYGNHIINVGFGELASGLVGMGRMAEPEEIIIFLNQYFSKVQDLKGKNVLITAGPTFESIDPVRFIGNRSSGKMGFALAEECAQRGAHVTVISGPVTKEISTVSPQVNIVRVESADDMYNEVMLYEEKADILIFAAAVADYKVEKFSEDKIKKSDIDWELKLVKTKDIAASCGKIKRPGQILIGFALETNDEKENALSKLHKKNLDLIVLNSLKDEGAGFQHDTNKICIYNRNGEYFEFPLKLKAEIAEDIVNKIVAFK